VKAKNIMPRVIGSQLNYTSFPKSKEVIGFAAGDYDTFMTTAAFNDGLQCAISIAIDVASHPQNLAAKA
jgi:hypothetical protein